MAHRCTASGRNAGDATPPAFCWPPTHTPTPSSAPATRSPPASLDTLHDLGRAIPDDIAIVGYDNWEIFAAEGRPPLTTIDLNLQTIGAVAVEHLFGALDGKHTSGPIRSPTRLVVRESTGPRIHA